MMMALGQFVFAVSTVAYQQLQRSTSWRHATQSRIGERPSSQFLGEGDDTISLSGTLMPEFTGGRFYMAYLRIMANSGQAFPMAEGTGKLYGFWVIESIEETSSTFMRDGIEQQIDFTLKLRQVDGPAPDTAFFYEQGMTDAPNLNEATGSEGANNGAIQESVEASTSASTQAQYSAGKH